MESLLLQTSLTLSLMKRSRFTGQLKDTPSIEVEYESLTFTSVGAEADITINPDGTWVFPNSNEGLDLVQGSNTFVFSATDAENNRVKLTAVVVLPRDTLSDPPAPPTDIKAERSQDSVTLSWLHSDPNVKYYNIYASTTSGGGANGYVRVNAIPLDSISYGRSEEKITQLSEISSDILTVDADPLILEIQSVQDETQTTTLGSTEIPENVNRLRIDSTVSSSSLETRVYFNHGRLNNLSSTPPTIPIGAFNTIPTSDPLYYVVTAVGFTGGQEPRIRVQR